MQTHAEKLFYQISFGVLTEGLHRCKVKSRVKIGRTPIAPPATTNCERGMHTKESLIS